MKVLAGTGPQSHRRQSIRTRVVAGHYRLNNGDIERGTCRGGKSVTVQHPDGVYRPISVGQAIYMGPDGNRHIEYRCGGSQPNVSEICSAVPTTSLRCNGRTAS